MSETNISLRSVVLFIFNQCKDKNSNEVDCEKIIEYLSENFDLNSEEATELKLDELFHLIQQVGIEKSNRINEQQFEEVLKLWIPNIQRQNNYSEENSEDYPDYVILSNTRNRLSKSLTNICHQIDNENNLSKRKISYIPQNLENLCPNIDASTGQMLPPIVPHEVLPTDSSIRRMKSCKLRRPINSSFDNISRKYNINCLNTNLHTEEDDPLVSISDTELIINSSSTSSIVAGLESHHNSNNNSCFINNQEEIFSSSTSNLSTKSSAKLRHRSSIVSYYSDHNKDLLNQLKQIKFRNVQLSEINERLQLQLEQTEDNLKQLTSRCMELERRNKILTEKQTSEAGELESQLTDIRKRFEAEVASRRQLISEKVLMETQLMALREHTSSLADQLAKLDEKIESKEAMIDELRYCMRQQQEMYEKVNQLNSEKDKNIEEKEKVIKDLSDSIVEYQDKIRQFAEENSELQEKYYRNGFDSASIKSYSANDKSASDIGTVVGVEPNNTRSVDWGGGGMMDAPTINTTSQYLGTNNDSIWHSLNVELTDELLKLTTSASNTDDLISGSIGPFCERNPSTIEYESKTREKSFNMLNGLTTIINEIKSLLHQYQHDLEMTKADITSLQQQDGTTSHTTKGTSSDRFFDEISLAYISHMQQSINLLSCCAEKATICQGQFNNTFDILTNRIHLLISEKKNLILQNEKLAHQLDQSSNNIEGDIAEKLCFLESELRKERLINHQKQIEINQLKSYAEDKFLDYSKCTNCGNKMMQLASALDLANENSTPSSPLPATMRSQSITPETLVYDPLSFLRQTDEDLAVADTRPQYHLSSEDLANIRPRYKLSRGHMDRPIMGHLDGSSATSGVGSSGAGPNGEEFTENSWLENHTDAMEDGRSSVFAQPMDDEDAQSPTSEEDEGPPRFAPVDPSVVVRTQGSHHVTHPVSSSDSNSSSTDDMTQLPSQWKYAEDQSRSNNIQSPNQHHQQQQVNVSLKVQHSHSNYHQLNIPGTTASHLDSISNGSVTPTPSSVPQISIMPHSEDESEPNLPSQSPRDNNSSSPLPQGHLTSKETGLVDPASRDETDHITTDKAIIKPETLRSISCSPVPPKHKREGSATGTSSNRTRRPNTIAGTNLVAEAAAGLNQSNYSGADDKSEVSSNYGGGSRLTNPDDLSDLQDSIDLLEDISATLAKLSPEELQNKYMEITLQYETDRPSVVQRAQDASYKCNKALSNVEQEFNILRHLIKNVSLVMDNPNELLPRIKASLNVLEKCVEYVSAKSEILGASEQEMKMCRITDVMHAFSNHLTKEKEDVARELEEIRLHRESCPEYNPYYDPNRTKKTTKKMPMGLTSRIKQRHSLYPSLSTTIPVAKNSNQSSGEQYTVSSYSHKRCRYRSKSENFYQSAFYPAKARFQQVIHATATQSSVLRQLAKSTSGASTLKSLSRNTSVANANTPLPPYPTPASAAATSDEFDQHSSGASLMTRRKLGSLTTDSHGSNVRFFPSDSIESNNDQEAVYNKGLQHGLRLSADSTLNELRAQQSRFSAKLDSFSELLEQEEDSELDEFQAPSVGTSVLPHDPLAKGRWPGLIATVKYWIVALVNRRGEFWQQSLESLDLTRQYFYRLACVIVCSAILLAMSLPWIVSTIYPSSNPIGYSTDPSHTDNSPSFSIPRIARRSSHSSQRSTPVSNVHLVNSRAPTS